MLVSSKGLMIHEKVKSPLRTTPFGSSKEAISVGRILFPLKVMSKDHLNAFQLELSDSLDRLFSLLPVGVNATNVAFGVLPFANLLLFSHDPPIMARISRKVYSLSLTCPR